MPLIPKDLLVLSTLKITPTSPEICCWPRKCRYLLTEMELCHTDLEGQVSSAVPHSSYKKLPRKPAVIAHIVIGNKMAGLLVLFLKCVLVISLSVL